MSPVRIPQTTLWSLFFLSVLWSWWLSATQLFWSILLKNLNLLLLNRQDSEIVKHTRKEIMFLLYQVHLETLIQKCLHRGILVIWWSTITERYPSNSPSVHTFQLHIPEEILKQSSQAGSFPVGKAAPVICSPWMNFVKSFVITTLCNFLTMWQKSQCCDFPPLKPIPVGQCWSGKFCKSRYGPKREKYRGAWVPHEPN